MSVLFAIEQVVAVQHDEMIVAFVERVVTVRHPHTADVGFGVVGIHIVIADHMVFVAGETCPNTAERFADTVQPTKITQFDHEIDLTGDCRVDKGFETGAAVRHILGMEIGSDGESQWFFGRGTRKQTADRQKQQKETERKFEHDFDTFKVTFLFT